VTAVKQALGQSSNTLLWKALMATELEELAAWQKAQPRARAERAAGAAASGTAAAKPAAAASPEFDVSRLNVLDRILAMIFDRWPRYTDDEAAHTAVCKGGSSWWAAYRTRANHRCDGVTWSRGVRYGRRRRSAT